MTPLFTGVAFFLQCRYTKGSMKRKFAAFDIDGTLVRWQLFHAIVAQLVDHGDLSSHEFHTMQELFQKWKTRTAIDSFHQYESAMLASWQVLLQHVSYDTYTAAVHAAFDTHKDHVYRYTRDLIAKLKRDGYFLIAISGSQQEVVDKVARYYQFDVALGSHWSHDGSTFTGERISPIDDKGLALQRLIDEHNLTTDGSWAVGDSASDSKMLRLVANPIAFNPDRDLFAIATQHGWTVVIERKNMIYTLAPPAAGQPYQLT